MIPVVYSRVMLEQISYKPILCKSNFGKNIHKQEYRELVIM